MTATTLYRPGKERGHTRLDWLDSYHTFSFGDYYDPRQMHFGTLRVINEDTIEPGGGFGTHGHRDMEILTYVTEGALQHKDSLGSGSIIRPGELQRMTAGTGILHSEFNASNTDSVHLLQIWIMPDKKGREPEYEQRTFDPAQARNQWQLIASKDGRENSITVHQDMSLYLSHLENNAEISFELPTDKQAWIQLVHGLLSFNNQTVEAGDGIGVQGKQHFEIKALEASEVLLFELVKAA